MISVQCGKLLAIVPGKRVSSISMVPANLKPIEFSLRFDTEAGVLCESLASGPVFQGHQQLVVGLLSQPVDVL